MDSVIPVEVTSLILKKITHEHFKNVCALVHASWVKMLIQVHGPFADGWVTFVAQNGFPLDVTDRVQLMVSLGCTLYPNDCAVALRTVYSPKLAIHLLDHGPPDLNVPEMAVMRGDVITLEHIVEKKNECLAKYTTTAAKFGKLSVLQFLERKGMMERNVTTTRAAGKHGHFTCLQFVFAKGCPMSQSLLNDSIQKDEREIFEFVLDKVEVWAFEEGCETAVRVDNIWCLRKMMYFRMPPKEKGDALLETAARMGSYESVQFLYGLGFTIKKPVCAYSRWMCRNTQLSDFLHLYANLCTCGEPVEYKTDAPTYKISQYSSR